MLETLPALGNRSMVSQSRRIEQVSRDILRLHGDRDHDRGHDPYR